MYTYSNEDDTERESGKCTKVGQELRLREKRVRD